MIKGAVKAGVVSYADSLIDLKVVDHDTSNLAQNIQSTVLTTGVETAVYGGSYIDNLKNNVINNETMKATEKMFSYIGHKSSIKDNLPAKTVVHALVGGVASKLRGGDFSAGAIATATGHVIGEYVTNKAREALRNGEVDIDPNDDKAIEAYYNKLLAKADALSSIISGAVTIQAKGNVSDKDLAISQEMSKSVVKNNSMLKVIKIGIKAGLKLKKVYKKKGKITFDDLQENLKDVGAEEAISIIEDILVLTDGKWNMDDIYAGLNIVVGIDLKSEKGKAEVASKAQKIYDKIFGSKSNLREFYSSIKKAPGYPKGFQQISGGTKKVKINNKRLLEELKKEEAGKWYKVYKDGYSADGNAISIHYFQSESGKVFNVKTKIGHSNG